MLDYQPNSWLWEDDAILSPCLFLYTLTHTVTLIPCFVVRSQRNRVRDLEESIYNNQYIRASPLALRASRRILPATNAKETITRDRAIHTYTLSRYVSVVSLRLTMRTL